MRTAGRRRGQAHRLRRGRSGGVGVGVGHGLEYASEKSVHVPVARSGNFRIRPLPLLADQCGQVLKRDRQVRVRKVVAGVLRMSGGDRHDAVRLIADHENGGRVVEQAQLVAQDADVLERGCGNAVDQSEWE